jgi:hypothetical protein
MDSKIKMQYNIMSKKNKVLEFIIDETLLIEEVGSSELVWL